VATFQQGDPLPEMLVQARTALEEGRYQEAVDLYEDAIDLALYSDDSSALAGPMVARLRLGLAEGYRAMRENDEALRVTEDIFDSEPGPETLDRALEIRYEIGLAFLGGSTRRLLGLEVRAERKGIEILTDLVRQYPYQGFSDDAIYQCASWYLKNQLPKDAERYFQRLLMEYPESSWAAPSQILMGDALLAQIKGYQYDMAPLAAAEQHYRRYLRLFPNQGESQRARNSLNKIAEIRAKRRMYIARYYLGIDRPKSARIYLEKVILDVPDSNEAAEARQILEGLARKAEES